MFTSQATLSDYQGRLICSANYVCAVKLGCLVGLETGTSFCDHGLTVASSLLRCNLIVEITTACLILGNIASPVMALGHHYSHDSAFAGVTAV